MMMPLLAYNVIKGPKNWGTSKSVNRQIALVMLVKETANEQYKIWVIYLHDRSIVFYEKIIIISVQ